MTALGLTVSGILVGLFLLMANGFRIRWFPSPFPALTLLLSAIVRFWLFLYFTRGIWVKGLCPERPGSASGT